MSKNCIKQEKHSKCESHCNDSKQTTYSKAPKIQLDFYVVLSFEQELRENLPELGKFVPASKMIADPHVIGNAKLHFDSGFRFLDVEVNASGDLTGDRAITLSHLHLDDASATGPLTVSLFPNTKATVTIVEGKSFSLKIRLTNSDIIPRTNEQNFSTNSIASLYNAIRGNNLYVDVHGGGDYLLGMIRGQIF